MLEIYKFFDQSHKFAFVLLLVIIIFSAVIDLISVFFTAFLLSNLLDTGGSNLEFLSRIIDTNYIKFLIDNILIFAILSILLSVIFRVSLIIFMQKFSAKLGTHFSKKAFESFYSQEYEKIEVSSSSLLTSTLANKITSISVGTVFPTLNIISNLTTLCLMLGAALIVDFAKVSLIVTSVVVTYLAIYLTTKKFKEVKSKAIADNLKRIAMVSENSHKFSSQVILKKSEKFFINKLKIADKGVREAQAVLLILAATPRYVLEAVIWISLFLIIASLNMENSKQVLTDLVFIALAFQRIMPGVQQVYTNLTTIASHRASVQDVLSILNNTPNLYDGKKNFKGTESRLKSYKIANFNHHKFGDNQKNNSFEMNFPSWALVTGPSGKGKSTLLKMVAGLYKFDCSQRLLNIEVEGETISAVQEIPIDKIHPELQGQDIIDGTLIDNLYFTSNKKLCLKTVKKVLEIVELLNSLPEKVDQLLYFNVKKLSGGERQRLAIARAILSDAEFILLDETTSGLDSALERRILTKLKKEYSNRSLMMIAHDTTNSDLFNEVIKV